MTPRPTAALPPWPGPEAAAEPEKPNNLGELPPCPSSLESFTMILGEVLGEVQDRDGATAPKERSPHLESGWLRLAETALLTGVFVGGSKGSGMTEATVSSCLGRTERKR